MSRERRSLAVAVYASSREGRNANYIEAARDFGQKLAELGITLVNGGGRNGGMGAVNEGCKRAGGKIICVIHEKFVVDGVEFEGADEMIVAKGNHLNDRKRLLADHADIIIALPGGIGTFDELFEAAALSQLNFAGFNKPLALLNTDGYYSGILQQLDRAHTDGLLSKKPKDIIFPASSVDELVEFCLEKQKKLMNSTLQTNHNSHLEHRLSAIKSSRIIASLPSFLSGATVGILAASLFVSFCTRRN